MQSRVDWLRHPAVMVWSDDWNMCAWAPDRATWEATCHLPFMQTRWSAGTLETAMEMRAIFDVLRRHTGGDGLPVVFEGYYVVGNPDYDAIEANGFDRYVDVGIDAGVSPGWERGNFLNVARGGVVEGFWSAQYHHRTHHFSGAAWVRRLKAGDPVACDMFSRRMYVSEAVKDRTRENDQPGPEPFAWIQEGVDRFQRAFGYVPESIRSGEQDDEPVAATGIRTYVNRPDSEGRAVTGQRSAVADLFLIGKCVDFEPFMADDDGVVSRSLADITTRMHAGLPVALSTHRRNYVSFAGDVSGNLALLDAMLDAIRRQMPDMTYLTSDEVRQLLQTGASCRIHGATAIFRNWTENTTDPLTVQLPEGARVTTIEPVRRFAPGSASMSDDGSRVLIVPGDYRATLEPV